MSDSKDVDSKSHRGIPAALFIEDLAAECSRGGGPDEVLKQLHNLYGSFIICVCLSGLSFSIVYFVRISVFSSPCSFFLLMSNN
jgi:hypothetical protein